MYIIITLITIIIFKLRLGRTFHLSADFYRK
jgi:hypothetical protein